MNQKQIGIVLMVLALLLFAGVTYAKYKEDLLIDKIIDDMGGSCYLDDGTCLHNDRNIIGYIIGWVAAGVLLVFGIYLSFVDKTQERLAQQQVVVSKALEEAKRSEKSRDEFSAFLAGFSDDEQKILKVVRDQDGIKQATIRYKTGLSKTAVSLILKSLEEKKIVSRKVSGKTNQVYLQKKF